MCICDDGTVCFEEKLLFVMQNLGIWGIMGTGGQICGRGTSKKFGTRYLFLQPLKLATEKLVHIQVYLAKHKF